MSNIFRSSYKGLARVDSGHKLRGLYNGGQGESEEPAVLNVTQITEWGHQCRNTDPSQVS